VNNAVYINTLQNFDAANVWLSKTAADRSIAAAALSGAGGVHSS